MKFLLATVCCLLFSTTPGFGQGPDNQISFSSVLPERKGCVFVYGGLSSGFSEDFLIEDCGDVWKVVGKFNFGYIKKIEFLDGNDYAVIGSSLVRLRTSDKQFFADIIRHESEDFRLWDLFFVNESLGWACGEDGLIYRTQNGGQSWNVIESGTEADLREIRFTDNQFGWTVGRGESEGENHSYLLTSMDGGSTWIKATLPEGKELFTVFFTSRIHGCGIEDSTKMLCTWNGVNWNSIAVPDEHRGAVFFLDPNNGWVVGASIMKTTDGGRSWRYSLQDTDTQTRRTVGLNLDGVYFASQKIGWAWGLGSVYRTVNAGRTWQRISDKWISELKKLQK